MPNTTCPRLQIFDTLVVKVDIALQSIKQISYKGTIDWEHSASANLGIGVHVQKNPSCSFSAISVFETRAQYCA